MDVSILSKPIATEKDEPAIYVIYRDISERKKAQEALKKSEERHRTLGLDGPDDGAIQHLDGGGGKIKPSAVVTQMLEKLFSLETPFHQGGWLPFGAIVVVDFPVLQLIENHICHDRPFLFSKRLPVVLGAHHLISAVAGEYFQGMVPVGHHVVTIDDKGGDGAALDDLGKRFFLFVKFYFDLLEPAVPLHHDVSGFSKALIDPVFDGFSGDGTGGQGIEGVLTNGFQS